MKFCLLFSKKPCKVELQMAESLRNLEEAEKQVEGMRAAMDGEDDWILAIESKAVRGRERQLTHAVEGICTQT